jgi:hypothetical protein
MSEKLFETAVRSKFRFPFKGLISAEDLWDLSVEQLDSIFKVLNTEVKQVQEESLLEVKSQQDKELTAKIEIVKYVVKVKLEEAALKLQAKEKKEEKQKLLKLLAEKQDENLKGKSIAEIQAMINDLDN